MTILPFKPIEATPHDVLIQTISEVLNNALTAEEAFTVEEVANRIATAVEPTEDDLERIRIWTEYAAADFIDKVGFLSPVEYDGEGYDEHQDAIELSLLVQIEVARGPAGWRDTLGDDRKESEAREAAWLAAELASAA
jgi:hypothetical protein